MITAYHYTQPQKHEAMLDGRDYGKGLKPIRRFVTLDSAQGLPKEAYNTAGVFCFLEERPDLWIKNKEFPEIWRNIISGVGILSTGSMVRCLRFGVRETDDAYVVDRSLVERISWGAGRPTSKERKEAYLNYWESRVPVFEYKSHYSLPELVLFSAIEAERLEEVWTKPLAEVKAFAAL